MKQTKRKGRSIDLTFKRRILFLGRNSGIQGLGHLFRENAPFFARLFWLLVLLLSLVCLYLLLIPLVSRGAEVSYTAETRYLPWTTVFPAVTVCETFENKHVLKKLDALYPDLLKPFSYGEKIYFGRLAVNSKLYKCEKKACLPCGSLVPCDVDWRKIFEKVRKNCTDLLAECKENGKAFSCCERFRMVDSDSGPCYSFNTLHGENPNNQPLFSLNRSTGRGILTFQVMPEVQIYLHSTEELPTKYLDDKLTFSVANYMGNVEYTFSLVDFENDSMLENVEIFTRRCRYSHEVPDETFDTYKVYSYGACKAAHDTEHAYKQCGCVHPIRDLSYKDKYCDLNGMNCLTDYETKKRLLGHDDHDPNELDPCLPSCAESELTKVHLSSDQWKTGPRSNVTIKMVALPTLRYQRNLLRTDLDLVVSVGGLVGLFFGASILSLVEVLYLFLRQQD